MIWDDKKTFEVIGECYRRMYKETKPVGDIDKIKKSGEGKMEGFFMAYYLSQERQDEILKQVIKDMKVPKRHQSMIDTSVILGASPCGNKETSAKYRKTHAKRLKEHFKKLKQDAIVLKG